MNPNIMAVSGLGNASQAFTQADGIISHMGGPVGIAKTFIGLGELEQEAGVPGWAWFVIGVGAGALGGWFAHDRFGE
jgi:hypothetical protein